jgi:hypothetical protein
MPGRCRSEVPLSGAFVLEPPYGLMRPGGREVPRLGAIVAIDLGGDPLAWINVRAIQEAAPWCPLCLIESIGGYNHRLAPLFEPFSGAYATLLVRKTSAIDLAKVVEGVRRRPPPRARELARYVAQRTKRPDLLEPLQECFDAAAEPRSTSSARRSRFSRRFADFKPWTARDWAAVARLIQIHSWIAVCPSTPSLEQAANDNGMDPRTLQSRLQRYLRCSYLDAVERAGWEWMIEASLRVRAYAQRQVGTMRQVSATPGSGAAAVEHGAVTLFPRSVALPR